VDGHDLVDHGADEPSTRSSAIRRGDSLLRSIDRIPEMAAPFLHRLATNRSVSVPADPTELAPVLGIRAADLLAMAGWGVPAALMPADADAKPVVAEVAWHAPALSAVDFDDMRAYARALPRVSEPASQRPAPPPHDGSFGALFHRLMEIRNLNVQGLARLMYAPESLIVRLVRNEYQPSPSQILLFAAALDLRPDDLATLAGSAPPQPADASFPNDYELVVDLGLLAWELTPLTQLQIRKVLRRVRQRRDMRERQSELELD
jgi:hypothetical protein